MSEIGWKAFATEQLVAPAKAILVAVDALLKVSGFSDIQFDSVNQIKHNAELFVSFSLTLPTDFWDGNQLVFTQIDPTFNENYIRYLFMSSNAIIGFSNLLLLQEIDGTLSTESRQLLETIHQLGKELLTTIHQITQIPRISA